MNAEVIPVGNTKLEGIPYPSLGDRFAVRLPRTEIVPFYEDNWQFVTGTGLSSFLKSLSIPEGYFKRLTASTRIACLAEAAADVKTDLMLLTQLTKVQYVAPARFGDKVYAQDPIDHLKLSGFFQGPEGGSVRVSRVDCITGYLHLVMTPTTLVRNEYVPSLQVRVPLFYAKDFMLSYGLYKVVCSNGLLDVISQSEMKMSFANDPCEYGINDFVYNMVKALDSRTERYQTWINRLRNHELSMGNVRAFVEDPLVKKALPGAPLPQLKKHASLLYSHSPVPPNSPQQLSTMYDIMDALTFYAARLGENTDKQRKAEKSIFHYFANLGAYDTEVVQEAQWAHA